MSWLKKGGGKFVAQAGGKTAGQRTDSFIKGATHERKGDKSRNTQGHESSSHLGNWPRDRGVEYMSLPSRHKILLLNPAASHTELGTYSGRKGCEKRATAENSNEASYRQNPSETVSPFHCSMRHLPCIVCIFNRYWGCLEHKNADRTSRTATNCGVQC